MTAGRVIRPHLTSTTRIADFAVRPYAVKRVPRDAWATGDYVLAEVILGGSSPYEIEAPSGRVVEIEAGDLLVGALGRRAATLAIVGDWRDAGPGGQLNTLNMAGVLGRCTSRAVPPPPMAALAYRGHLVREGEKCTMGDFVPRAPARALEAPVVLIIGTSMDSGKTVAAKAIVRRLRAGGLHVGAAKLTGVGRFRDVLAMGDAGADPFLDFVDGGLPSTAAPAADVEAALANVLARLAVARPDVVVAEAGASPLEPYHGDIAVRMLGGRVRCTVLCASDPYAVVGVMNAFGTRPDLVSGRATSTEAGRALIDRLCGVPSLNLLDHRSDPALDELLSECLGEPRLHPAVSEGAAWAPGAELEEVQRVPTLSAALAVRPPRGPEEE